jgi:hypothetical protein
MVRGGVGWRQDDEGWGRVEDAEAVDFWWMRIG